MSTVASMSAPNVEPLDAETAEHEPPPLLANHLRLVRQHILQAIDSMQQVAALLEDEAWKEQSERLAHIAGFVEEKYATMALGQRSFLTAEQFQNFSMLLSIRREAAHLLRPELAKRAGLSAKTIKNIETMTVSPSHETVTRLLEVPELNLDWKDVLIPAPSASGSAGAVSSDSEYNCYVPPGYDSVRMVQQLARTLNGPGGHVEQTNAYLEHRSAMGYLAMCHEANFVATYRAKYPLDEIAQAIIKESGQVPFKVIAVGAGDGHLEVRLVQHLLTQCKKPDIELMLFDISQPLLNTAYQHAIDTFGEQSDVHTLLVHGNFHDLPRYPQVSYTPARGRRRRIYTMLGYTLANLDNELRFFQHSLSHCQVGDFLLLDFQRRSTPSSASAEEILQTDLAFSAPFSKPHENWLAAPLRMHCLDLLSYEFRMNLETGCPVPGSYALDAVATVRSRSQPERRFSMFRFKRYDEEKLRQSLARFGWDRVASLSFGVAEKATVAMLLVKRGNCPPA